MNAHQSLVLRISSTIAVGVLAFCLTLLILLPLGHDSAQLAGPMESEALLSPQFMASFVVSLLVGSGVAVSAGRKYYHYISKSKDT